MEYKVIRHSESNDDYIEHAIFGLGGKKKGGMEKGGQKENHLYLARQWIGNKWRYAYTQAQVRAMQNWGKGRGGGFADQKKLWDLQRQSAAYNKAANKAGAQIKKNVNRAVSDAQSSVYSKYNTAKTSVDTAATKLKNNAQKTAKNAATNVANKVKEAAPQIAKNAAGAVRDAANKTRSAATDVANKAKNAYEDLRDYSEGVDARERKANDAIGNATYRRNNETRKANTYREKAEDAARNADKKGAIDNLNLEAGARNKARAQTSVKEQAVKDATEARQEKSTLKYKISDLMSNGAGSETAKAGKRKVDQLLSAVGTRARNTATAAGKAVSSAASKTLSAASDLASKGKNKLDSLIKAAGSLANDIDTKLYNAKVDAHNKEAAKSDMHIREALVKRAADRMDEVMNKYSVGSPEWQQAYSYYDKAMNELIDTARETGDKKIVSDAWDILREQSDRLNVYKERKK